MKKKSRSGTECVVESDINVFRREGKRSTHILLRFDCHTAKSFTVRLKIAFVFKAPYSVKKLTYHKLINDSNYSSWIRQ